MKKNVFMGTTQIAASVTVGQLQKLLGEYGASHILMEYDSGEVSGLVFNIHVNDGDMPFRLPCRWKNVLHTIQSKKKRHTVRSDWEAMAKRIAWRQILRWVEAQLALVETGMVKIQEVFTPYLIVNKTKTLYEQLEATQFQIEYKK